MNASEILFRVTLAALSLVGLYTCFCFAKETLARFIKPLADSKPLEAVCKDGSCLIIAHTRWAKLLGVPNWWFGTAFYLLTIIVAIYANVWFVTFAILGSLGAAVVSLILIYGLAFQLKSFCRICYLAHAVNFAILICWAIGFWRFTA